MRRPEQTVGQNPVRRGHFWLSLASVTGLALLSGCGWFGDSPADSQNVRPGADRQAPVTNSLPPATSGQHDAGITATDPAGTAQIGSIIPAKGGQKAQKEAIEKEAAERDAKDREAREKREAEEREAKAKEEKEAAPAAKSLPPAGTLPGMPAAAERGNPETGGSKPGDSKPGAGQPSGAQPTASPGPPVTTAPPPAPVTTGPLPPPTAPPPNPAPAAEPPAAPPRT